LFSIFSDPIRHNIGTHLKHNKYIFDISIPFCHHLYLSTILKQCFTEFAVSENVVHHVYMSVPGRIPTCDFIGTHLKHNKYIFDISIPFCHHLYLSTTLKQCFTEFAVSENVVHHVYMSVPGQQAPLVRVQKTRDF
jgi:hypothetical protein